MRENSEALSPLTCTAEQLYTVVSSAKPTWLRLALSNSAITPQHLVTLLRNLRITPDVVEAICNNQDWLSDYKVQCGIVNCAKTPHVRAMRLLPLLFWNDLVRTCGNMRLSPRIRRQAEIYLRDKIGELSLGEKMTLAKTGPRPIVTYIRSEDDARVVTALLRNPHVIEDDVLMMVNDEFTDPTVLAAIGSDYKWSSNYQVKLALARTPRSPLSLALSILSKLRKQDLDSLAKAPHTRELIRRAATRILEGKY